MKLINRPEYLNKLINVIGTPDIKVITGVRRSGKSILLSQFADYLIKTYGEKANIISVDYNQKSTEDLLDADALYDFVTKNTKKTAKNFILIDEVQMCDGFEKAINYLYSTGAYDIYITGSNAFLLSSDLATLFTGRTFEIEMYPFSFSEYLRYYGYNNLDEAFGKYLIEGGMAGVYAYTDENQKYQYLASIFDTMIIRDINMRHDVRNESLMNMLSDFMIDNISNLVSRRSIANALYPGEYSEETKHKTIGNYIQYLVEAFAFYRVRRYNIKGKKYLASTDKYYLVDHAIRYAKLGTKNMDYGRMYENIVAIELLRRGYDVYVGTLYNKEIDFVAMKKDEVLYIQVSDDITNPDTLEREISPLLSIKDAYPKILLANTHHEDYTIEGVKIFDIARWLVKENNNL